MFFISKLKEIVKRYSDPESVLIYQMGKVGSSSLESRLENSIHFHSLYGKSPCHVHMDQNKSTLLGWLRITIGDFLKRFCIRRRPFVKIITMIRDPYARNVSMFFQDIHYWVYKHIGNTRADTRKEGDDMLFDAFEKSYDHFYFDRWFDEELKKFTGIDVFECPFPENKGYQLLENKKYKVLLVKMEDLDSALVQRVIEDFTGQTLSGENANTGNKKWYAPLYQRFRASYQPSKAYLDALASTKTYAHFYGEPPGK